LSDLVGRGMIDPILHALKIDVYSFGIVLLCEQEEPYSDMRAAEIIFNVQSTLNSIVCLDFP
jgi:hypothetical protein